MKRKIRLGKETIWGLPCGSPAVKIAVRTRYGTYAPLDFVVDGGALITGVPIRLAEKEGIPFVRSAAAQGIARGMVGEVGQFRGSIHLRMFGEEFDWPCAFLEEPAGAKRDYALLGRAGFIGEFESCLTDPFVTIARRRDRLPLWQRLVPRWAVEHPADELL